MCLILYLEYFCFLSAKICRSITVGGLMQGSSRICRHHDVRGMDVFFSEPSAPKRSQASHLQKFEEDVKLLSILFNIAT